MQIIWLWKDKGVYSSSSKVNLKKMNNEINAIHYNSHTTEMIGFLPVSTFQIKPYTTYLMKFWNEFRAYTASLLSFLFFSYPPMDHHVNIKEFKFLFKYHPEVHRSVEVEGAYVLVSVSYLRQVIMFVSAPDRVLGFKFQRMHSI